MASGSAGVPIRWLLPPPLASLALAQTWPSAPPRPPLAGSWPAISSPRQARLRTTAWEPIWAAEREEALPWAARAPTPARMDARRKRESAR